MSKFLSLKSESMSQPDANDPLERQTWCSLRIQVGSRFASRLWDRLLEDERDTLDIPAFPIAEWIIQNWWSLFNELCPWNLVPRRPIVTPAWLSWTRRHCLRSADSALLLPNLFLYSDGDNLLAESHADQPGSLPNMPGEFLSDGVTLVDSDRTEVALARFVNHTMGRLEDIASDRADQAAGQWHAIQNADLEEREFCKLAGRMGLDPYNVEEVTGDLARFFEEMLDDADEPLVRDLTESARPESVEAQWLWVTDASRELHLGPRSIGLPFDLPEGRFTPADYGYELARRVRAAADVPDAPIESLESTASAAIRRIFHVEPRNHIPGQGIKAIVGQSTSGRLVAAGPESPVPHNQRFMNARSLFHALATSQKSQRLVTGAYSSDQKASRAFAAEFLAPQAALRSRLSTSTADPQTVETLSKEFRASTYVIEWQLENAGVFLSSD